MENLLKQNGKGKSQEREENVKDHETEIIFDEDDFVAIEHWEAGSLGETENGSLSSCFEDDPSMSSPGNTKKNTVEEPDPILHNAITNLASSATFHATMTTGKQTTGNQSGSDEEKSEKSAPHEAEAVPVSENSVTAPVVEPDSAPAVSCENSVVEDAEVSDLQLSEEILTKSDLSQSSAPEEKHCASDISLQSCETVPVCLLDKESPHDAGRDKMTSKCYGGSGGKLFDTGRDGGAITEIAVNAGALVDGITITYDDRSVRAYGGGGGSNEKLVLEENDFVNKIHVRYSHTIVQCMTFMTNKRRQLGPCGGKGSLLLAIDNGPSEDEWINAPDGCMLVGIKGRAGIFMDSIGFHWAPIHAATLSRDRQAITRSQLFGGAGGKAFDLCDTPEELQCIHGITINAGDIVDGITLTRKSDIRSVGGVSGSAEALYLEKDEFIEEVHVRYNKAIVQCLTFKTNFRRQLGPCGGNGGLFLMGGIGGRDVVLKSPTNQKLVGIHGRAGRYLDSIGFCWGPVQN